jgi:hypothetical protein
VFVRLFWYTHALYGVLQRCDPSILYDSLLHTQSPLSPVFPVAIHAPILWPIPRQMGIMHPFCGPMHCMECDSVFVR